MNHDHEVSGPRLDLLDLICGPRTTENCVSPMKMFKRGGLQIPATQVCVISKQVHVGFGGLPMEYML